MAKNLYIDASHPNETRVVLKSENSIEDYEYESINNTLIKNNIYLGKVSRIEPSLQAAFVDFGRERHGFLSFNDIQTDYYQLPKDDLEKIKIEEEKARVELSKESEIKEISEMTDKDLLANDENEKNNETLSENENKKVDRRYPSKRYKIQEVIKPNQVILVQVLKDERGLKEMGIIVRTAGSNKTKNEINEDLKNLIDTWNKIKEVALNSIAPAIIHKESDIIKRSLRDMFDDETQNIIVEGNDAYQRTKGYIKEMLPKHLKKVKKYRDKIPLFFKEKIESKLYEIFKTEVKLSSGGYLVINPTEALISIDINSGRSIKQKNVESTAVDTNLEAAEEIARQLKIRDLSGLIIIDFIDMLSFNNKKLVEKKLKDRCRKDRARIQIGRISNFGLLEMSRQRLRESSVKWQIKLTKESFSLKTLKLLELKTIENKSKIINLKINENIKNFMEENFKENINYFQKKNKVELKLEESNNFDISEYEIEFKSKSGKIIEKIENLSDLKKINFKDKKVEDNKIIKFRKKKFYKKKFFKKKVK